MIDFADFDTFAYELHRDDPCGDDFLEGEVCIFDDYFESRNLSYNAAKSIEISVPQTITMQVGVAQRVIAAPTICFVAREMTLSGTKDSPLVILARKVVKLRAEIVHLSHVQIILEEGGILNIVYKDKLKMRNVTFHSAAPKEDHFVSVVYQRWKTEENYFDWLRQMEYN